MALFKACNMLYASLTHPFYRTPIRTPLERGIRISSNRTPLTHPDYASLVDPLFACGGKRVKKTYVYSH